MIRSLFAALGRFLLLLVATAFIVTVSLFVFASFLLTWPILRLSPRDRKLRAAVDFASAGMTLVTVLGEANARKAFAEALVEALPDPPKLDETEED